MTTLAFSYSHADEALRDQLEKHLSPLKRLGLIDSWHDRRIVAGQEFNKEIDEHFAMASVILLLISPDFIDSDYCYEIEMTTALARHERKEAIVIPVIVRPCHWSDLPFGKILAATKDGKAVTQFKTLDEGFYEVVDSIKKALRNLSSDAPQSHASSSKHVHPTAAELPTHHVDRSSNLRIKREFNDLERDQARVDCFEFVTRYFQNSMTELKQRNPEIKTGYDRIDSKSFEAKIYVGGRLECACGIWHNAERFGGGIFYGNNGVSSNSYNESISVHDDAYTLGFKPMGMSFSGNAEKGLMTFEGVGEYLWSMFIRPLQR